MKQGVSDFKVAEGAALKARFAGINQARFAEEHGVPGGPSMISQNISGHRPITMEAGIAYALGFGVTLREISARLADIVDAAAATVIAAQRQSAGVGMTQAQLHLDAGEPAPGFTSNVRDHEPGGRVPLVSWVQAGAWTECPEVGDWIDTDTQPGDGAFALRVEGDSMVGPDASNSFPEGTVIVIDPTRGYAAGDLVVARDGLTGATTFKQLVVDSGRWFLRPLNPTFPTMPLTDGEKQIIGPVVEAQRRWRPARKG